MRRRARLPRPQGGGRPTVPREDKGPGAWAGVLGGAAQGREDGLEPCHGRISVVRSPEAAAHGTVPAGGSVQDAGGPGEPPTSQERGCGREGASGAPAPPSSLMRAGAPRGRSRWSTRRTGHLSVCASRRTVERPALRSNRCVHRAVGGRTAGWLWGPEARSTPYSLWKVRGVGGLLGESVGLSKMLWVLARQNVRMMFCKQTVGFCGPSGDAQRGPQIPG